MPRDFLLLWFLLGYKTGRIIIHVKKNYFHVLSYHHISNPFHFILITVRLYLSMWNKVTQMIIFQILPAFFLINKPRSHLFTEITALSFKKSFQLKSNKVQHFKVGCSITIRKNQKMESGGNSKCPTGKISPHHPLNFYRIQKIYIYIIFPLCCVLSF